MSKFDKVCEEAIELLSEVRETETTVKRLIESLKTLPPNAVVLAKDEPKGIVIVHQKQPLDSMILTVKIQYETDRATNSPAFKK